MRISISPLLKKLRPSHKHDFFMFYSMLILLSFHWYVVTYINSSFLEEFTSATNVSFLYACASIILLVAFFYAPRVLQRIGNYRFTLFWTLSEIVALIGLGLSHSAITAIFFFFLHFISVPLVLFGLDVFIEHLIGTEEKKTGGKRGLYLSLASLAGAMAPLLSGSLLSLNANGYSSVYFASIFFLLPFLAILFGYFRAFKDPDYGTLSIPAMIEILKTDRDTRNITAVSVYLQMFFTWTYIFIPLYLAKMVGFSWYDIGLILFVALSAYVFLEYPIGVIADLYIGEKEMMALGFLIISVSLSWFAFLGKADIGIWMIAMFLTRTGASFVESTSESYFFKHAESLDAHKISLFRMTRPFSSVLGALIGTVALLYLPFNLIFIVFAFVLVQGLYFTMLLVDTK